MSGAIRLFEPRVPPEAIRRVGEVLRGHWIGQGPLVSELETSLARMEAPDTWWP